MVQDCLERGEKTDVRKNHWKVCPVPGVTAKNIDQDDQRGP